MEDPITDTLHYAYYRPLLGGTRNRAGIEAQEVASISVTPSRFFPMQSSQPPPPHLVDEVQWSTAVHLRAPLAGL